MDEPRSGRVDGGTGPDPDAAESGRDSDDVGSGRDPDGVETLGESIRITNEVDEVVVRKVHTGNGVRLEIESPTKGHRIRLDAVALESLTWQDPTLISEFLEEPRGSEVENSCGSEVEN